MPKKYLRVAFDKNVIKKELEFMSEMICGIMRTASKSENQESVKDKIVSQIIPAVTENIYHSLQLDEFLKPHKIVPLVPRDLMLEAITPGTAMYEIANRDDGTEVRTDQKRKNILVPSVLEEDTTPPYVPLMPQIKSVGTVIPPVKWAEEGRLVGGKKIGTNHESLAEKMEKILKKTEALEQIAKETITVKKSKRRKNSGK